MGIDKMEDHKPALDKKLTGIEKPVVTLEKIFPEDNPLYKKQSHAQLTFKKEETVFENKAPIFTKEPISEDEKTYVDDEEEKDLVDEKPILTKISEDEKEPEKKINVTDPNNPDKILETKTKVFQDEKLCMGKEKIFEEDEKSLLEKEEIFEDDEKKLLDKEKIFEKEKLFAEKKDKLYEKDEKSILGKEQKIEETTFMPKQNKLFEKDKKIIGTEKFEENVVGKQNKLFDGDEKLI